MVWINGPKTKINPRLMAKPVVTLAVAIIRQPLSKKGLLAALFAGVVASLALPPHGITLFLLALALPGLQLAFARDWRQGAMIGWATGLGWFIYSIYWISNALVVSGGSDLALIPFSALGLPAFLALFWAAGFALSARLTQDKISRLILLIAGLALMEYARGIVLTGFPWNLPGMVLANTDITLAMASILGVNGGTVVILTLAMIPAMLVLNARAWAAAITLSVAGLMVCSVWSWGQSFDQPEESVSLMQVRMVQPNIPQNDKWDRRQRPQHLAQMMTASRAPANRPLDLIIWPETAFAGFYEQDRGTVNAIALAASSGVTPVLMGILSEPDFGQFYNAAGVYAPGSGMGGSGMGRLYHKRHLVPFGEYVPLRSYLPFIDAIAGPYDFSSGQTPMALSLERQDGEVVKLLPLICYEVIFPSKVRQDQITLDADVLVNLTNDAWFGDTIGPRQHLAMAQMRSAELGMPMIRVANTGISAVIDSHGRLVASIAYGQSGFQDAAIRPKRGTFYLTYGDVGFWGFLGLLFAAAGVRRFLTPNNRRM